MQSLTHDEFKVLLDTVRLLAQIEGKTIKEM